MNLRNSSSSKNGNHFPKESSHLSSKPSSTEKRSLRKIKEIIESNGEDNFSIGIQPLTPAQLKERYRNIVYVILQNFQV